MKSFVTLWYSVGHLGHVATRKAEMSLFLDLVSRCLNAHSPFQFCPLPSQFWLVVFRHRSTRYVSSKHNSGS